MGRRKITWKIMGRKVIRAAVILKLRLLVAIELARKLIYEMDPLKWLLQRFLTCRMITILIAV